MQETTKPRSKIGWILVVAVLFLIGGAALGVFVLPRVLPAMGIHLSSDPTPTAALSPTPDGTQDAGEATPTPSLDPTATPGDTPLPSESPAASPTASPTATPLPTPTPTPAPTPLPAGSTMTNAVVDAKHSVVTVIAQYGKGEVMHSGFVYDEGLIVTTYAGFEKAQSLTVLLDGETKALPATIVQKDETTNLLVLRVSRSNLVPVTFATSTTVLPGDPVFAIGTPLDVRYQNLVTTGIIAGVNRPHLTAPGSYLITTAATNPGHDGGALFNAQGQFLGMLTSLRADAGYDQKGDPITALGMSFAIPGDVLRPLLVSLSEGTVISRPTLGLSVMPLTARQLSALSLVGGARVTALSIGGPAQLAGLANGDIIIAFNGVSVADAASFDQFVGACRVGEEVTLTRMRNGLRDEVKVLVSNVN